MTGLRGWTVLASDFDGTLAVGGWVPVDTLAAVARFRQAGGTFVLVTGRRLDELFEVFPETDQVADRVVAENGGVLYDPIAPPARTLVAELPSDIAQRLKAEGVDVFELGQVLVSASREDETAVRRVADGVHASWPCQVVPNRDRVMLLPAGMDKGTGLAAAVAELGKTADDVLAIGDGENDVALLSWAGMGVAVADAVPVLRKHADALTLAAASAGVVETIDRLLTA